MSYPADDQDTQGDREHTSSEKPGNRMRGKDKGEGKSLNGGGQGLTWIVPDKLHLQASYGPQRKAFQTEGTGKCWLEHWKLQASKDRS